jgi:uroporphyrinogen-III synthase
MRVIVTRPEREAQRWVLDLAAQGFEAVALPLIQVGPVMDTSALLQAWRHLADYRAVMFVSGNAVAQFFIQNQAKATVFTAQAAIKTRAWATGPGTAKALLREGVAAERLDAPPLDAGQFDSEALWQVVAAQVHAGDRVLIVRGAAAPTGKRAPTGETAPASDQGALNSQGAGRDWLTRQLVGRGAQVDLLVAYQRAAPAWRAEDLQLLRQAAGDGSVWLFSSSEAIANLSGALPGQDWASARALATHPRIAQAARQAGFGLVCESRPTLADVVSALKLCS